MPKYHGFVGFEISCETSPGVYEEKIVEREYYGDKIKDTRSISQNGVVNSNVNVSARFSILADPYAALNFLSIRYITYMGTKWIVTSVDNNYPRLELTVGGVYNGQ